MSAFMKWVHNRSNLLLSLTTHTVYMVANLLEISRKPVSFFPPFPDVWCKATYAKASGHPVQAAVWGTAEQHQARCGVCDSSLWRASKKRVLFQAAGDHPACWELYEFWLPKWKSFWLLYFILIQGKIYSWLRHTSTYLIHIDTLWSH